MLNKELGRSGYELVLQNDFVRKISPNKKKEERLYKSFKKQKEFRDFNNFAAVQVRDFVFCENSYFDMDFILGQSFFSYCITSNISEIKKITHNLIDFLKFEFQNSVNCEINQKALENKVEDVIKQIGPNFKQYETFLSNYPKVLPIGKCHGDFTLSNIIFADKYYLIDFLDNIFESPLFDLVKIMQDLEYKFYVNLIDIKDNKIKICTDFMASAIWEEFKQTLLSFEYTYFTLLNLLRLIPYVNQKSILFIKNILDESFNTCSRQVI